MYLRPVCTSQYELFVIENQDRHYLRISSKEQGLPKLSESILNTIWTKTARIGSHMAQSTPMGMANAHFALRTPHDRT